MTNRVRPEGGRRDLRCGGTSGPDGGFSNAVEKRFGKPKDKLGLGHDLVFQFTRKAAVTHLKDAGVSENAVTGIVGHEKPRATCGYTAAAQALLLRLGRLAN